MRLRFLTATPLNVTAGSGTYTGIATLLRALRERGVEIDVSTPTLRLPVYTAQRLWFNRRLRPSDHDVTVGFDMDGYTLPGAGRPHIASIKGVIADEMRFERGLTRATLALQARCERQHVLRAEMVVTTSHYSAERIREFYGEPKRLVIVPEAIDLDGWRALFRENPAAPDPGLFTVLCVCRFYPRKRLRLLLEAAALLRYRIPGLRVRIVGGGPEAAKLRNYWRDLGLQSVVAWLGDVDQPQLAREFQQCDIFCLPSVQEGFGIVFLEAMAAGKAIVAARAGAAPEVVAHSILVEPGDAQALARGIEELHAEPAQRRVIAEKGRCLVEQLDAPKVAGLFLEAVSALLRAARTESETGPNLP